MRARLPPALTCLDIRDSVSAEMPPQARPWCQIVSWSAHLAHHMMTGALQFLGAAYPGVGCVS
jgi:hypothetical protein